MKKYIIVGYCLFYISQIILSQNKKWNYPEIAKDSAIDYYFGKEIIDPYRNLEKESDAVNNWLNAQNQFYDTIIYNISYRDSLRAELKAMAVKQKTWGNFLRVANNRYFYQVGYVDRPKIEYLVYFDSLDKEPIELFNTQLINEKHNSIFNITYYEPSFDGNYLAFGIAANGDEKTTVLIIDVKNKELLHERVERTGVGNIQWVPDNSGFFYIQEKELLSEEDKNTPYEDRKVKFHKIGTDPSIDKEIFNSETNKTMGLKKTQVPMLFTFPTSDKVLINIYDESYFSIFYAPLNDVLTKPAKEIEWQKVCDKEAKISCNALHGNTLLGVSFKDNPDGQLILMQLPNLTSKVLFNASGFAIDDMVLTKKGLYFTTTANGYDKLMSVNLQNYKVENIKLPFSASLSLRPTWSVVSFYQPTDLVLFALTGHNTQFGQYICDKNKNIVRLNVFPETQYTNPPLDIVSEEIEVPSYDGVMVPLSIIYKRGIKYNGSNPTIIQAYGAYGYSFKPAFDRNRLAWFNNGGIYAIAHVRGGGEKGDRWYKGGFKATKPNSWKDLIACAEYMIRKKYTSPKNLATKGISAGGITVARAITERPDLFKAALLYVSDFNAIRMENSFNNTSITEFGTVKDSLEFQYLYEMDAYHHVKRGIKYPSVLFSASKNDARVAVWGTAKGVAIMQEMSNGENVILFQIQDEGHYSYPSDTDSYSFLFWQLGHPKFKLKEKNIMFKQ